ncbi:transcriptional regulator [Flavobacterium sp. MK4S-17]|uniref:winged helix-turn-helix domain-containing protein n=1 Tax=Flavobacterium sp. MK4S-17 TaxID=2543737 RepID=UPI001359F58A|nr:transcriptional regulator [Flavobacterium sp. MK4S-17]
MKNILQHINKAFDHRIRLGIMSILMVNEYADFNTLKELLGVTDGNLASHAKALENEEYITIEKQFVGKKPNTRYIATKLGRKAFKDHIDALEKLIQKG